MAAFKQDSLVVFGIFKNENPPVLMWSHSKVKAADLQYIFEREKNQSYNIQFKIEFNWSL